MLYHDNPRIWATAIRLGEEQPVSDLIYSSLEGPISETCPFEVVQFLKNLYSPINIMKFYMTPRDEFREMYIARHEYDFFWVLSLMEKGDYLDVGAFYGLSSITGAKSAFQLLKMAESDVFRHRKKGLTGKVLSPARSFIEKAGEKVGYIEFGEPRDVIDIDPVTNEEITLNIMDYIYTPDKLHSPDIIPDLDSSLQSTLLPAY